MRSILAGFPPDDEYGGWFLGLAVMAIVVVLVVVEV
jgi:hypothetical protein